MFTKGKTSIIAKLHRTDIVTCSHSREGETPSYSQTNTVVLYGSHLHVLEGIFSPVTYVKLH